MSLGRASLRQWVQTTAVTVWAEFEAGPALWTAPDGSDRQEWFRIRLIEQLAGPPLSESAAATAAEPVRLDFATHAEGLPGWKPGERALVFLERSADHPGSEAWRARLPWVSLQGAGDEWRAGPEEAEALLGVARGWAELARAPQREAGRGRSLLLTELRSPLAALRADGLSELIRASRHPDFLADPETVSQVAASAGDARLSLGQRIALVQLLSGRPGFDAPPAWRVLASSATTRAERIVLARAVARQPEAPLDAWLVQQLAAPDVAVRRAAAWSLGRRGGSGTTGALAQAARDPNPAVARGAIRALGEVQTPEARAVLGEIAGGDDPRTARWAAAELRRRRAGAQSSVPRLPSEGPRSEDAPASAGSSASAAASE